MACGTAAPLRRHFAAFRWLDERPEDGQAGAHDGRQDTEADRQGPEQTNLQARATRASVPTAQDNLTIILPTNAQD